MRIRHVRPYAIALLAAFACTSEDRAREGQRAERSTAPDSGAPVTTQEMRAGLSRDVRSSDHDLAALEDTIYRSMGDTIAVLLKQAHTSWEHYRKLECDALRLAFAEGTLAPVAQLECWVAITDARRRFLGEEYEFIRPTRVASPRPPR